MASTEKHTVKEGVDTQPTHSVFAHWLHSLGPAVITAALVLGPGSLTVSTNIGALHGYQLIWVLVIATIFMMVFTEMSARIGMATDQTLLSTIRDKWGQTVTSIIGIGAFLVTASFQAGNAIGSGAAFGVLTNTSSIIWTLIFTLLAIVLLFVKNLYKVLEKLMLVLVALMLMSFLITLFVVKPNLSSLFRGFVPNIPHGSMLLIIALFATTFSVVGAFYQSYFVQERGWDRKNAKDGIIESYSGILILGLISGMVMVCAAKVLLPQGITVNSVVDLGKTIGPLYGSWSTVIFMLGLWGAAFSSLTANATIGGALLADALGLGRKLSDKGVRYCIIAVMVIGAGVAIFFQGLPIQLILFAQAITIVVVPLIGISLYVVANDKEIMGDLRNSTFKNVIGIIGLLVLLVLAGNTIKNLFF
ncbi:NRAMP (natural resistance-associated macrophage protein)-like metal ion transporter [Caldalkalibacillus uzonensis]|uniref:NRAMP (Natural resistance-associated macrophage protein)-like metal ion transporter n=1 Tax=Caldalkalibacillus uzonensis TaxID=353224 RepID=A0ABU0CR15_9BACI|nr:Nramp family divalent metal transporter [Caldalkalibacillus uzonensis]MDQ0338577.1 NRAMP (natural resistance-associated macrophage protein)-like metal ion transporter [Caldalkalibacillus uzonensis]